MKIKSLFVTLLASSFLVGCGTLGGAVSGAGEDLTRAGNWIKNR
jgi:predicted small secreted protein